MSIGMRMKRTTGEMDQEGQTYQIELVMIS